MVLSITLRNKGLQYKHDILLDNNWNIIKRIVLDKREDLPYPSPKKYEVTQSIMFN